MKKLMIILFISLVALFAFNTAHAAYIDLRVDTLSMAYDGETYIPAGSDISLEVWIMPDPGVDTMLGTYSLDILYDVTEGINYTGGIDNRPSGWFSIGDPLTDLPPYVQFIEGMTFGADIDISGTGWKLATLFFEFDDSLLVLDGEADFSAYYRPGQGLTINAGAANPMSIGPDLAAVPIPGAVWLLGSCFLGLIGIRKKIRK